MAIRGNGEANVRSTALVARLVDGPHVSAPDKSERQLKDWLADLAPGQAAEIEGLLAQFPRARTILLGIAEASPYLFDLVHSDAARGIRVLLCEPERHLAQLIENTSREVHAASSEASAMQLLRRAKSEAALLIALCDIGGVWPVMQVTAALTELAVASVQSALRFLLRQEASRGRMFPPNPDRPEEDSGLIVLAMGKMGAGELNFSSDIDLIVFYRHRCDAACARHRAAAVLYAADAGVVADPAATQRRRLCVPRRFAAAPRSGLDAGGDLDRLGAALLRAGRAHLGTRRHDQGAALRRRHQGRRGAARRSSRPLSGASIWILRRLPTSTT